MLSNPLCCGGCCAGSYLIRRRALRQRKRGSHAPLSCAWTDRSGFPAILATSLAGLIKRDQALAAHRERRIQEGLLVELRQSRLETIHRETRSALLQHIRDRRLNRCGDSLCHL